MTPLSRSSLFIASIAWIASSVGCSGVRYYAHPLDPTSTAVAKIDTQARDEAHVTDVSVQMDHVIPPNRVHAGGVAYYAWTRSPSAEAWHRLGLFRFNPSGHDALVSGTAPDTRFDFLITIEDQFDPTVPSTFVFLSEGIGNRRGAPVVARPVTARAASTSSNP